MSSRRPDFQTRNGGEFNRKSDYSGKENTDSQNQRQPVLKQDFNNGISRITYFNEHNSSPHTSISFSNFVLPSQIQRQNANKEQRKQKEPNSDVTKMLESNTIQKRKQNVGEVNVNKINDIKEDGNKSSNTKKKTRRRSRPKQREVQKIIHEYKDKLRKLNKFKHEIKSIMAVKKVTKPPTFLKTVKPNYTHLKELKKKSDTKSETLQKLFAIAGDDWAIRQDINTFSCPAKDGYYPSPSSCSVYYRCVYGQATRLECSSGTSWNTSKEECDWEGQVNC